MKTPTKLRVPILHDVMALDRSIVWIACRSLGVASRCVQSHPSAAAAAAATGDELDSFNIDKRIACPLTSPQVITHLSSNSATSPSKHTRPNEPDDRVQWETRRGGGRDRMGNGVLRCRVEASQCCAMLDQSGTRCNSTPNIMLSDLLPTEMLNDGCCRILAEPKPRLFGCY